MIIPTHTCFDDALDFFDEVMNLERLEEVADDFFVNHGICIGEGTGEPYAHAWVEQHNARRYFTASKPGEVVPNVLAWQAGTLADSRVYFAIDRDAFWRDYRVQSSTSYPLRLALELNRTHGHFGPWRKSYTALCKKTGDGRFVGRIQSLAPAIVIRVASRAVSGG